ncbi:MAG: 16S rRNA (adenine(1518)-N(6)/adenine(1519)-N(6))-dimethyltransferase RsmA [Candidatus Micrarchaeota archaeon]
MSEIHIIKGLGADKKLGQNFLIDKNYIHRELAYCEAEGKDVLEIGPGIGALTVGLAGKAKRLTAIEIDERLMPLLKERLREFHNLELICGDALEFTPAKKFDLVVSNVPYYVASKLVLMVPELGAEAIICIQKELAERIVAKPGSEDYSRFSVMCQLLFDVNLLERVPAGAFYPAPSVESAIVRLKVSGEVCKELSTFINAIFQHRNKKLRNAVIDSRELLGLDKKDSAKRAAKLSLCDRRVITLSKEEVVSSYGEFTGALY